MSRFTDALVVTPLSDGRSWTTVVDFGYEVGSEDSGDTVDVATGFVTDFASVPRILWWVMPKWGKYGNAAVVHDWLYWEQKRPREEADRIMLEAMGVLKVSIIKRRCIYAAVRVFGFIAWKRNRWDRECGLDRVLADTRIKYSVVSDRPGILMRTLQRIGLNRSGRVE